MGVRTWGVGLVAAAVIAAVTASGAPAVQAQSAVEKPWAPAYDLPASLADKNLAETPHASPDKLKARWACDQRISIYYAAAPGIDGQRVLRELEYPVEYLRGLGYAVSIVREVAYRADYHVPTTPGDVLVIAPLSAADTKTLRAHDWLAVTYTQTVGPVITSARTSVDATRGLSSDVLLHELGHVLGLPHKEGTVMGTDYTATVSFDAAETAAIDCR